MAIHDIQAVMVTAHGGGEVLAVQPREIGSPGPGRLRVRVAASGVNFIDVYERQGVYPTHPPFVLGQEGAGEVVEVGPGTPGFAVGDVVAWAGDKGSHAQEALITAQSAVPVPSDVAPELAAAAMLQGMTAHYLVTSTYPVQPGDSVLIHAAAGGVGQLLTQLAVSRGAHVIATCSTEAKQAKARAAGAQSVIGYTEVDDLAAAVREANGGHGVSVVYDGVGKSTFDASLASLAPRGTLVLFGAASGQVPPFQIQRLNTGGSLFLTRPSLGHYIATRDELLWRGGEVLNSIGDGKLRVEIGGRYQLAEAAQAYAALESGRSTGKLLLIP